MEPEILRLSEHVELLKSAQDIICSDVGIVEGNDAFFLIDTGSSSFQFKVLEDYLANHLDGRKLLVGYTHFHPDHVKNGKLLKEGRFYGTKNTSRYTHIDEIISVKSSIDLENVRLEIIPVPSNHAKGSLVFYIEEDHLLFIGDLLCPKEKDGKPFVNRDISTNMANALLPYVQKSVKVIDGHDEIFDPKLLLDYLTELKAMVKGRRETDLFLPEEELIQKGFRMFLMF